MPHKYRVAIIGAGMICNAAHLPALAPLRKRGAVEVVAVADIVRRLPAKRRSAMRFPPGTMILRKCWMRSNPTG